MESGAVTEVIHVSLRKGTWIVKPENQQHMLLVWAVHLLRGEA